jgi:hypothetical protein
MRDQSCLAAQLGGQQHCSNIAPREIASEVVMMFIWLVPLGIIALLLLYIFGKFRV